MNIDLKERYQLLIKLINYLLINKTSSKADFMYEEFYESGLKDSDRARAIMVSIVKYESHKDWKILYDELDNELLFVEEAYFKASC